MFLTAGNLRKVKQSLTLRPACSGANREIGLSDKLFVLGDSTIITALYRIALMPVFVLSARICPEVRTARLATPLEDFCHGTIDSGHHRATFCLLVCHCQSAGGPTSRFSHLWALFILPFVNPYRGWRPRCLRYGSNARA